MGIVVCSTSQNQAAAWKEKADRLADWCIKHLFVRVDAFPEWVADRWRCTKSLLTVQHLSGHFSGLWVVGSYTISPDNTCCYTAWDIDCHDGDEEQAERNLTLALDLYERLRALGLHPIMEDSNGVGGYHVWILWHDSVPADVARRFGQHLAGDHNIEVFPKQNGLPRGGYGSQLRIPGHHHKRDHWSRFYDGEHWLEGEEAVDFLLSSEQSEVDLIPDDLGEETEIEPELECDPTETNDYWKKGYDGKIKTLDILKLTEDRAASGGDGTWHAITCPWASEHTPGKGDTAYVVEGTDGKDPVFKCHHGHCSGRSHLRYLCEFYGVEAVDACCAERFGNNGHDLDEMVEEIVTGGEGMAQLTAGNGEPSETNDNESRMLAPPADGQTTKEFVEQLARQVEKKDTEPPSWAKGISAADFDLEDIPIEWLVDKLLAANSPTVIGGRFKTLKTLIACDLVVSMSSGTKFLGKWKCKKVRVGVWSGESGRLALQNAMRRVCKARGIKPSDCDLDWHFELPPLYSATDLAVMKGLVRRKGYRAIFVDPAYLCLLDSNTASKAGNVFVMGHALAPLAALGQATGCLVGLIHHFGKWTNSNDFEPAELGELSQAGMAEWPRQWLLLSRRAPYLFDGRHLLYLTAGGSLGQCWQMGIDIHEGQADENGMRTEWKVEVKHVAAAQAADKQAKREERQAKAEETHKTRLDEALDYIRANPGKSASVIKGHMGINDTAWKPIRDKLVEEGKIKTEKVRSGKRSCDGFFPVEDDGQKVHQDSF